MLLLALVLLALAPCSSLSPVTFRRAESLTGLFDRATVTEREIVNVLGRWKTHRDWDVAPELDAVPEDAPVLKWSERKKLDPARTPQRRRMLTKMGQVQRYLFVQNVQTLPFKEDKLARSVGASARELNAEPISELAAEIVFDALSVSKSGIVPKDDCDARRASYVDADGAFDREAFSADVSQARFNILAFLAAYPGVPNLILLAVLYKKNALQGFEEYSADFTQKISEQWAPVTRRRSCRIDGDAQRAAAAGCGRGAGADAGEPAPHWSIRSSLLRCEASRARRGDGQPVIINE